MRMKQPLGEQFLLLMLSMQSCHFDDSQVLSGAQLDSESGIRSSILAIHGHEACLGMTLRCVLQMALS